jgi:hypothetical protein
MRRSLRLVFAVLAAAALSFTAAAPAGAQEELGLETNITEGGPGEIVSGQVDTNDIAENCVTDLEAFQARFATLLNDPNLFNGGQPSGPLFDRFHPPGTTDFVFNTHAQLAYSVTGLIAAGLSGLLGDEPAEEALPQTFVFTFADIETQEPVGEMSNFDAATGQGTVEVPDLEPGQWAVAAACVGPILDDLDALEAGIRASGEFLAEIGAPTNPNTPEFQEFVQEFLDDPDAGLFEFLEAIGPDIVENIVVPDALGAVIFCIFDETGQCPAPPPPPDGDDDEDRVALPVLMQPDFTG